MRTEPSSLTPRLVIGGAIAAFGVIELLDNFRVIDSSRVPLLGATLIMLGVSFWMTGANRVVASLLAGFGVWAVFEKLGFVDLEILELWPVAVIVLGISIFWRSWKSAEKAESDGRLLAEHHGERLSGAAVFSDRTIDLRSETSGGSFFSLFSSTTIDLSRARLTDGAVLDLLTLAASTKVIIPEDCTVSSRVFPFMAGYEDRTRSIAPVRQKLTVRGFTMWGSIEIEDAGASRAKKGQS